MEGEREKHQCAVASCAPPSGDLVPRLRIEPATLSLAGGGTQCTEPHQPEQSSFSFYLPTHVPRSGTNPQPFGVRSNVPTN